MAQISRAMDPHTRWARTIVDELKQKIPGMSETLWPRRDVWGEEVPNPKPWAPAGLTATDMQRISRRLRRQRSGQLDDLALDPGVRDFARIAGRLARMRLDTIVKSADWQTLPARVRRDVSPVAEGQLFAGYPHIPQDACGGAAAAEDG
jgi:hypothetical protein